MATKTILIKRGDTLWDIAETYAADIPGNTIPAKIKTLAELNKIKDPDKVYVGQSVSLSSTGSSSSSSKKPAPTTQAQVSAFGLKSDDTTGRVMIVNWNWSKTSTAGYTIQWTQYLNGKWTGSETDIPHPEDMYCQSTFTADELATKVRFRVRPYYKNKDKITYWSDVVWSDIKEYDFSNNPPLPPPVPNVTINDLTLTVSINNIKAKELDATSVKFNIVKDNKSSVHTSSPVAIVTAADYVSYQYKVTHGSEYKARACSVNSKGKVSGWSDFSGNAGTKPSTPSGITTFRRNKRSDGTISAYLEWGAVANATHYIIEYTTVVGDFDVAQDNVTEVTTEDARTSIEITNIDSGYDYFFRVRAVNANGESDPTAVVTVPIGEPPAAPTTWSSANSAFVGESMELNWTHNSRDGSNQTYAKLGLKINDGEWETFSFKNSTTESSGEQMDVTEFFYGEVISYKGSLYAKLDTNNGHLRNAKIVWKVQTAGVTDEFSDTDWSIERTIYIYERPELMLSMVEDLADENGVIVENLSSFPFYIRALVDLSSYDIQRPIGYHLRIVSNDFYETVDDAGRTKVINVGDAIYSKYFDTSDVLIVEMSADNIDLESGIGYTVYCAADMSTGLSVENSYEFSVNWVDVEYAIDANISIDMDAYTALITPYCKGFDGSLVENTTISIYRREYDGSFTEIAKNVPNNGTSITDPHPSLDYARYRLIAKDTQTGAISFYDMPGYPVDGRAVIIQWDEEWSKFDISDTDSVEGPSWSGSMLMLPYNIDVTDKRKREVELVKYVGRENPVSYYGTQKDESSTWNVVIPKDDKETIYALRRLSLWTGDVYVREPSGLGYWANITISFNQKHTDMTAPVTIDVTRVEGGM